uniref:IL-40-like Ig domain-containing protein n=1 Tax=Chinchilla lanigera TaxID=34839 RepID=A0A8C2YR30_CHILA
TALRLLLLLLLLLSCLVFFVFFFETRSLVYPQSRRVLLTCQAPPAPPPITYSLFASQGIQVARKVVWTHQPASFSINVTLKSSPDLLTYSCQASSLSGPRWSSTRLQMYWELWAKPVSQLQANVTVHSGGSGPRAEMSCWAPSGSPPITYRLVSKDGQVHKQKRPPHGQPANFSFPLPPMPGWFQCQAENSVGVQSSALTLVPPGERASRLATSAAHTGELPQGPARVLASSLVSIAVMASGMLGRTR